MIEWRSFHISIGNITSNILVGDFLQYGRFKTRFKYSRQVAAKVVAAVMSNVDFRVCCKRILFTDQIGIKNHFTKLIWSKVACLWLTRLFGLRHIQSNTDFLLKRQIKAICIRHAPNHRLRNHDIRLFNSINDLFAVPLVNFGY